MKKHSPLAYVKKNVKSHFSHFAITSKHDIVIKFATVSKNIILFLSYRYLSK